MSGYEIAKAFVLAKKKGDEFTVFDILGLDGVSHRDAHDVIYDMDINKRIKRGTFFGKWRRL